MKNITICIMLCLFFLTIQVNAQDSISVVSQPDRTNIGIGAGGDFGGFGANLLIYPSKNLGFFVGGGYALAGLGVNAGAKFRFISNKPTSKVNPYIIAMYGYNAAIAVANATQFSKLFYGPSLGFGIDYRLNPYKRGYWSMAILIPFRSSEVDSYMDDLKMNHGIEFKNELLPITFSIGYRFILN